MHEQQVIESQKAASLVIETVEDETTNEVQVNNKGWPADQQIINDDEVPTSNTLNDNPENTEDSTPSDTGVRSAANAFFMGGLAIIGLSAAAFVYSKFF